MHSRDEWQNPVQPELMQIDFNATHHVLDRLELSGNLANLDQALIETAAPKVAFLFLVGTGILHEKLWDSFFAKAEKESYSIYVHLASPQDNRSVPLSKWGAVLVPQVASKWCALSGVQIGLMAEALSGHANMQFVMVSDTTVPLKPFRYVYSELIEKSLRTSKICFYQHIVPMKHHQWVVLSRKHAAALVQGAEGALGASYAALEKDHIGCCLCSDELVVAAALFPDNTIDEPVNSWELWAQELQKNYVDPACLTFVAWPQFLDGSSIDLARWKVEAVGINGSPHQFDTTPVKMSFLSKLVKSEGFMFARKFSSGCLVSNRTHKLPLRKVLPALWEAVDAGKASSRVWTRLDPGGEPEDLD